MGVLPFLTVFRGVQGVVLAFEGLHVFVGFAYDPDLAAAVVEHSYWVSLWMADRNAQDTAWFDITRGLPAEP